MLNQFVESNPTVRGVHTPANSKALTDMAYSYSQLTGLRQAAALILSLEGDVHDAALRVPEEEINKDDGVDKIIIKLTEFY